MVSRLLVNVLITLINLTRVIYSCNEAACPLPIILNGNFTFHRPGSVFFRCFPNFTLKGRAYNQCVCSKWIYETPHCISNSVQSTLECNALYIQKGWVECLTVGCNRFYVGTEAAVRCERGYQLMGNSRLHCQWKDEKLSPKASWSSPVPKCVLIDGEYSDITQQGPSLNIFYNENSSIMIIIIILSVLACGLMLLISVMLMNRLVKRRRQIRFQRSDISFTNGRGVLPTSNEVEEHCEDVQIDQSNVVRNDSSWNCFSRNNTRYEHMETQPIESNIALDQECTPAETPELYSHSICSDDRASLINPPCYEEAIKCSQYSIVVSPHISTSVNSKENKKSKHDSSKLCKREQLKHLPIRSTSSTFVESTTISQTESTVPNILPSSEINSHNTLENTVQSSAGHRSNDVDNVSRRSARVHYNRIINNISAESNNSFLSGSIETMAVSDGTSVTVHTFDSNGSNPSIGSMRPQTGSIGDPTNFTSNSRQSSSRYTQNTDRLTESDFPDIHSNQRYSPPPSYESSINNQTILKSTRSCRSNTGSPSTSSNVALFVDNMACTNETEEEHIVN